MGTMMQSTTKTARRWLTVILLGLTIAPRAAWTQVVPSTPDTSRGQVAPSTPDTARAHVHRQLFNRRDAIIAGALTATTFVLFPLDKRLAQELRDSARQSNKLFGHAADGFELTASPGAYYIGGALYVAGRLGRSSRLADLGWHGTEAVLIGESITFTLKRLVGRNRPYVSSADNPRDFAFLKGFSDGDRRSFPSGHTTAAFAAAAAVTDETTIWWPRSTWFIGPVMYGGATMVGLSRMYHSKHWASDVALGALIGMFSGKKVVMATHDHPSNVIDRIMLATTITPSEYGAVRVGWTSRVPNPAR